MFCCIWFIISLNKRPSSLVCIITVCCSICAFFVCRSVRFLMLFFKERFMLCTSLFIFPLNIICLSAKAVKESSIICILSLSFLCCCPMSIYLGSCVFVDFKSASTSSWSKEKVINCSSKTLKDSISSSGLSPLPLLRFFIDAASSSRLLLVSPCFSLAFFILFSPIFSRDSSID